MLRRLFYSLLCFVFLLPGCASVPAAAQTPVPGAASSGAFTPHPVAPRPIAAPPAPPPAGSSASSGATTTALQSQVTSLQSQLTASQTLLAASQTQTKTAQAAAAQAAAAAGQAASAAAAAQSQFLAAQAQAAAAQAQQAALNSQVSALNQQLATLTPSAWGNYANPFADDTHLVFAHYLVAETLGGADSGGGAPAGYLAEMRNDAAHGIDGWSLDSADFTSSNYLTAFGRIFDAADALNQELGGKSNGHGVTKFRLFVCIDYANAALESPSGFAAVQAVLAKYASRPSYFHFAGKPLLCTYAGDGGGVPAIQQFIAPCLASLKAAGLDPYFVPGWPDVSELAAVDAPAGWSFGPIVTPLGDGSPLPAQEALAAQVEASRTLSGSPRRWMQSLTMERWNASAPSGRNYDEFDGGRGLDAQFSSALSFQHPDWLQLKTENDWGDGTLYSSFAASCNWTGLLHYNVPGFWSTQDGLQTELDYDIQRYKQAQSPVLTRDTLIVYNRSQLAAAAQAPAADPAGASFVTNPSGWASGLQNVVSVTAILRHSGFVRLSGVGPPQQQFVYAGVSHLTFYFSQAGTPLVELLQQGQVTAQVFGQPVSASAALSDLNVFSFASQPGVKFTVQAALPAGVSLDAAGLLVRSTQTRNAAGALGVSSLRATDLAASPAAVFAQNSLNNPAGVNQLLSASTLTGQDALSQYNGNGYAGLFPDPLNSALPPLAYATLGNTNTVYFAAGKLFPSSHVKVECDVTATSADPAQDGMGGVALVSSQAPNGHYFGQGVLAYISKYAGSYVLMLKYEDSVGNDSLSSGSAVLASLPINSMAPGEVDHVTLEDNAGILTATVVPGNQQDSQ